MPSFLLTGLKKIISIGKKVFLVIAVYFIVISLFFHFLGKDKAANKISSDPIQKNRAEIYKVINDPQLNKTKQGKLTITVYKGVMCSLIGEACTKNPKDGDKNFENSLFGKVTVFITTPFVNPPASGIGWVYSGLQSAGFIPKAVAAEGIGFAAIRPYANIWKIFRDVSYMLLVIILIAIGFMIMFRMKMNPQTVINVENALPRIVVAMILITFSFAIAGFMIDLMYVSIILIVSILSNGNTYYNATQFQNEFVAADALKLWSDVTVKVGGASLIPTLAGSLLGLFPQFIVTGVRSIIGALTIIVLNGLLHVNFLEPFAKALNTITGGLTAVTFGAEGGLGNLPGIIGAPISLVLMTILFLGGMYIIFPIITYILLGGTFVYLCFRIFTLIFTSYLKLILNIILSPFLLMFEAIPGKSAFAGWFKNIIGYLIVFPISIAVFLIGYIIVNSSAPAGYNELHLPYLNGIDNNSFKILVGVGLILLIPDLVKLTKEALGIKELPINFGVGTFFGGAGAVIGSGTGLLGQFSSVNLGLSALGLGGKGGLFGLFGQGKGQTFDADAEAKRVSAILKSMQTDSGGGGPKPPGENG